MMKVWLNKLLEEKGISPDDVVFEVEGANGWNYIPLQAVVDHILIASKKEQEQIKSILVRIDFCNGNVNHFFKHLAQAIAR